MRRIPVTPSSSLFTSLRATSGSALFGSQRRWLSAAATERILNSVDLILEKDRYAVSKAITLIESTRPQDAFTAGELLRRIRYAKEAKRIAAVASGAKAQHKKPLKRIAITGSPGAGKSCFIEALGMHLVEKLGLHIAVIAVDPSSVVTKGSILGDKTRMAELSVHEKAYVRPSPSRGHLGGVQARCWEVMELLEAAEFDVILVETVGVGQSEIAVKDMTDELVLLVPPASGDELQGVKKGIVEVSDAVIVTKMDGDREKLALQTRMSYLHAVCYTTNPGEETKPVHCVSSEAKLGIDTAWEIMEGLWEKRHAAGTLAANKKDQAMKHFHAYFELELIQRSTSLLSGLVTELEDKVVSGRLSPREAAEIAIAKVMKDSGATPPPLQ